MNTTFAPRKISMQQLTTAASSDPVWVLNTGGALIQGGGDIHILIQNANGQSRQAPLIVPKAGVAFELTTRVPRKALIESPHFMDAIAKGIITCISESDAQRINSSASAKEEFARLADRAETLRAAANAIRTSSQEQGDLTGASEIQPIDESVKDGSQLFLSEEPARSAISEGIDFSTAAPSFPLPSIDPKFEAMVAYMNTLSDEAAAKMAKDQGEFTYEQVVYLSKRCSVSRIQRWANKTLSRWDESN